MVSMNSKRLNEFLDEPQEPFVLEAYLVEKGCQKSRLPQSCSSTCMKRKVSFCSKIVRSLFGRILTVNSSDQNILKSRNQNGRVVMSDRDNKRQEIPSDDKFSTKSSSLVFSSCSESSDVEDAFSFRRRGGISSVGDAVLCKGFVDHSAFDENEFAGWKFRRKDAGNGKQLSPVSVLEETESYDDGSPIEIEPKKREESFLNTASTSKWEKGNEAEEEIEESDDALSKYIKNKKALQQTKHLLFDCLGEVLDSQRRPPEILGAEQLWQLLCQNLWLWSQESINDFSFTHSTHFGALASVKKGGGFEQQRREISMLVGDAIFGDICTEFLAEMISLPS